MTTAITNGMTWEEYLNARRFYQMRAKEELKKNNISEVDYMVGVVRGLDLAMKVEYELVKEKTDGDNA